MELLKSKTFWMIVYLILSIASVYWGFIKCFTTPDWLSLIGSLILGLILMLSLFDFLFKEREAKLRSSEEFVKEVFEKPVFFGHVGYENDKISPNYVFWAEKSPFFPYVIKHLEAKKYKKFWQLYIDGQICNELLIFDIIKKIKKYRELVIEKLELGFKELKSFEQVEYIMTNDKNQYQPNFINHLIYNDVQYILKTGKKMNELKIVPSLSLWYRIDWGGTAAATGDNENSLAALKDIIVQIENDELIVNIIKDINSLNNQLQKNGKLEQFDRWRKEIINQVLYEKKTL